MPIAQLINLKVIIIITVAVIIAVLGYYQFLPHDELAEQIDRSKTAQSTAAERLRSDYTNVGKTNPINIPGNR